MIPKAAIEKAIEGGFRKPHWGPRTHLMVIKHWEREQYWIALDPSFWQALGKALGWYLPVFVEGKFSSNNSLCPNWLETAHDLYDLILTGGDTEKFWLAVL